MTKKKALTRVKATNSKRGPKGRPYPGDSLTNALILGEAILLYAPGGKIRRLTPLEKMQRPESSSATQRLITNSSRYGITVGLHTAEWIEAKIRGQRTFL